MSERPDEEGDGWVATAIGGVTAVLALSVVGVYAYGSSMPDVHEVAGAVDLSVPPQQVYALLSDYERRPEWRPAVARIGRIDDDGEGRQVWRELDGGDDRFDFTVVEEVPGERVVLSTASPDQIGYDATWAFTVHANPDVGGSTLEVVEVGEVDNPLWRGVFYLRSSPWQTVEQELRWVADALSPGATPRRVR